MNRLQPIRRSTIVPSAETSMRVLEYAVGLVAAAAALLLSLAR